MITKVLVSLLLIPISMLYTSVTHAQIFGYNTLEECINKELQKYREPTDSAAFAVLLYCEAEFEIKADKEIRRLFPKNCDTSRVNEFIEDGIKIAGSKHRLWKAINSYTKLKCP